MGLSLKPLARHVQLRDAEVQQLRVGRVAVLEEPALRRVRDRRVRIKASVAALAVAARRAAMLLWANGLVRYL